MLKIIIGGPACGKKTPRGGGVFTTGTPHHIYSAYISALIGVLEEAQLFFFLRFRSTCFDGYLRTFYGAWHFFSVIV